jgi:hypothetical protein
MGRTPLLALASVTLGLLPGLWQSPAFAQLIVLPGPANGVAASVTTPLDSAALSPNGTTYLRVLSHQNGAAANATTTPTVVTNGVAGTTFGGIGTSTLGGIRVPTGPRIRSYVGGGKANPVKYLPAQPKSKIKINGDVENLTSTSGGYTGTAQQFQSSKGVRGIFATGFTTSAVAGIAAAEAFDPISLAGGTGIAYSLDIDVDFKSGNPKLDAGAEFFAVDSNSAGGNPNVFDPTSDDLWTLDFSEDGTSAGPGNIGVDFELNPSETEISFSSSELTTMGCASAINQDSCIDTWEDTQLDNDFTSDGAGGEMEDVQLFDGATYTPGGSGPVEYAIGVDAGVEAPEPPSSALLVAGLAALAIFYRRRSPSCR